MIAKMISAEKLDATLTDATKECRIFRASLTIVNDSKRESAATR
jgi:hypothetical protein